MQTIQEKFWIYSAPQEPSETLMSLQKSAANRDVLPLTQKAGTNIMIPSGSQNSLQQHLLYQCVSICEQGGS